MGKTDYAENKVLDHMTGKAAWPAVTAYLGLFTAAPTDAGGGTEVSGGSYARKATAAGDWAAAAGGSTSNVNVLSFPAASAPWGTVTHFGLFDAATAGNLLAYGALTNAKTIGSGDTASFAAGALTFTED
jgi:hypothetical protein